MRRKVGQPHFIDPSLIQLGDEISVEHKANRGITTSVRGVVAQITDVGRTHYLITEERATLLAWEPGIKTDVRVTLYAREEPEHATMFDMSDIERRLAS